MPWIKIEHVQTTARARRYPDQALAAGAEPLSDLFGIKAGIQMTVLRDRPFVSLRVFRGVYAGEARNAAIYQIQGGRQIGFRVQPLTVHRLYNGP